MRSTGEKQVYRAYMKAIDAAIIEADKGVFISGKAVRQWMRDLRNNPDAPMSEPDVFKK